jgi:hypothetical protein
MFINSNMGSNSHTIWHCGSARVISNKDSRSLLHQVDPVAMLLQANRSGDAAGDGGAAASAEVEKLKEKVKVIFLFCVFAKECMAMTMLFLFYE